MLFISIKLSILIENKKKINIYYLYYNYLLLNGLTKNILAICKNNKLSSLEAIRSI